MSNGTWGVEVWMGGRWEEVGEFRSFDAARKMVNEYIDEGQKARWSERPTGRVESDDAEGGGEGD